MHVPTEEEIIAANRRKMKRVLAGTYINPEGHKPKIVDVTMPDEGIAPISPQQKRALEQQAFIRQQRFLSSSQKRPVRPPRETDISRVFDEAEKKRLLEIRRQEARKSRKQPMMMQPPRRKTGFEAIPMKTPKRVRDIELEPTPEATRIMRDEEEEEFVNPEEVEMEHGASGVGGIGALAFHHELETEEETDIRERKVEEEKKEEKKVEEPEEPPEEKKRTEEEEEEEKKSMMPSLLDFTGMEEPKSYEEIMKDVRESLTKFGAVSGHGAVMKAPPPVVVPSSPAPTVSPASSGAAGFVPPILPLVTPSPSAPHPSSPVLVSTEPLATDEPEEKKLLSSTELAAALSKPGVVTVDPITGAVVTTKAKEPEVKKTARWKYISGKPVPVTGLTPVPPPPTIPAVVSDVRTLPSLKRQMEAPTSSRASAFDLTAPKLPITRKDEDEFFEHMKSEFRQSNYARAYNSVLKTAPEYWAMLPMSVYAKSPAEVKKYANELIPPTKYTVTTLSPQFIEKWINDQNFYQEMKDKIVNDLHARGNEKLQDNLATRNNPRFIADISKWNPVQVGGNRGGFVQDRLRQLAGFQTLYNVANKPERLQALIGFAAGGKWYNNPPETSQFTSDEFERIMTKQELIASNPKRILKRMLEHPNLGAVVNTKDIEFEKTIAAMISRLEQAELGRENGYMDQEDYQNVVAAVAEDLQHLAREPNIAKIVADVEPRNVRAHLMVDWRVFNDRIRFIDDLINQAPNNLIAKKLKNIKDKTLSDLKATGDLESAFDRLNGIRNIIGPEIAASGARNFEQFVEAKEVEEEPYEEKTQVKILKPEYPVLPSDLNRVKDPKEIQRLMTAWRQEGVFAYPTLKINTYRPVKVTKKDPKTGLDMEVIERKSNKGYLGEPMGALGAYNEHDKTQRGNLEKELQTVYSQPLKYSNDRGVNFQIPINVFLDGGAYIDPEGKTATWKAIESADDLKAFSLYELDTLRKGLKDAIEHNGVFKLDYRIPVVDHFREVNPKTKISKRVYTTPKREETWKDTLSNGLWEIFSQLKDAMQFIPHVNDFLKKEGRPGKLPQLNVYRQSELKPFSKPLHDIADTVETTDIKSTLKFKPSKSALKPPKELRIDKELPMGSMARQAALGEAAKKYSDNNFKFSRKITKEEPEVNKAYYGDKTIEYDIKNAADLQRMKSEVTRMKGQLYVVDLRTGRLFPIAFDKTFIGQNYVFVLDENTSGTGGKKLQHRPRYQEYNKKAAKSVEKGGGFGKYLKSSNQGYNPNDPPIRAFYPTLHGIMRDEEDLFPFKFMRNGRDKGQQMLGNAASNPYFNDYRDQIRHEKGAGLWKAVRKGIEAAGKGAGNYTIRKTVAAAKDLGKQTIYEGKHFVNQSKRDIGYIGRANQQFYKDPSFGNFNKAINKTVLGSVRLASRPVITAARETANASDFLSRVPGVNVAKQAVMFYAPPLAVANALVHGVKNVDEGRLTDAAINAGDALIGSGKLKGNIDLGARVLQTGIKIGDKLFDKSHNKPQPPP